jgi:hypothetical protein
MTGTMTTAEAGAVSEILGAAGRGSYVAYARPSQPDTLVHGRARRIGDDSLADDSAADIRNLLLYVAVEGYGECGWPLRDLIPGYLSGWFVVDFDLAAYYEAIRSDPARKGENWPPLPAQQVPLAVSLDPAARWDQLKDRVSRNLGQVLGTLNAHPDSPTAYPMGDAFRAVLEWMHEFDGQPLQMPVPEPTLSQRPVVWDTEHPAGHAPYCARPFHSLSVYCAASPEDPPTMLGQPSRAWQRDHPEV